MTLREFAERFPTHRTQGRNPRFVQQLFGLGLVEEQIEGILEVLMDNCFSCFDNESGCQCSNDE